MYTSPEKKERSFGINVYERISNKVAKYNRMGSVLILGDMNVHTELANDFVENDTEDNNLLLLPGNE